MRILLIILVLYSCSTARHRTRYFDSTTVTRDTLHVEVKKDSTGYDSISYHRQTVEIHSKPRLFKYDGKFWIVLAVVLAVLVKVYTN